MILNDRQISKRAERGMISPFEAYQVRRLEGAPVISYGLSSFGYDIRLSPTEFRIFRHIPGTVIDPKNFNPDNLEPTALHEDENGSYFILPGHSYGLGVAVERLEIPRDITVICLGKSTYARVGLIANLTPGEAGWEGNLTLEFSNSSHADCRIYADEGVVQCLFLAGEPCAVGYGDRPDGAGKYQGQGEKIVTARV